mgnify:CR=1 FL=1
METDFNVTYDNKLNRLLVCDENGRNYAGCTKIEIIEEINEPVRVIIYAVAEHFKADGKDKPKTK